MKAMRTLILVGLLMFSVQAWCQDDPVRTITVFGRATSRIAPDRITWTIKIQKRDEDLQKAKQESDVEVANVKRIAGVLGLADEQVEIGNTGIERRWKRDKRGNIEGFSHYEVTRTIVLHEDDVRRFEEFLDALVMNTDLEARMQYQATGAEEEMDRLRIQALQNALDKATDLATAVGATVGKAISISEFKPAATRSEIESALAMQRGIVPRPAGVPEMIDLRVQMYATFALE